MRVQQELLPQNGCLISFSLNIPGQCKRSPLADRAFQQGRERIRDSVALPGKLLHEVIFDLPTGLETLMVIDSEPGPAKKRALLLEETSPIGRYYDIDIISSSGEKLSRLSLGYPPRRCFLCGQNAFLCRRQQMHTEAALLEKMNSDLRQHFMMQDADEIAGFAQQALLTEAAVSPKPGLVDRFSPGAHQDMDFYTFLESASALRPWFQMFALAGLEAPDMPPEQIFPRLRTIGLQAEGAMLQATGGINTHKGCIFSLGVLCAAMGQIPKSQWTVSVLTANAGKMAANALSDFSDLSLSHSHGVRMHSLHGADGIRGEAARGFPSVQNIGLPTLKSALRLGFSLNDAAAWTLLHLLAQVEDTNILFRGGSSAASRVHDMAAASIDHIQRGLPLHQVLQDLDRSFTAQNLSPGGCADLLALTLFLHFALLPS